MEAKEASAEPPMEARMARVESDVAHLRSDVADIKLDVRSLRDKTDAMHTKLSEKIDGVEQRFEAKMDARFQRLEESIATTRVWALGLYVTLAGATFATMARGFGWI